MSSFYTSRLDYERVCDLLVHAGLLALGQIALKDFTAVTNNVGCPHEQGDVESQNRHVKPRLEQHLILRRSRDLGGTTRHVITCIEHPSFARFVVNHGPRCSRRKNLMLSGATMLT